MSLPMLSGILQHSAHQHSYITVLQGKWQEQTLPPHPLASTVNNLQMPCMSTAISTTTTILWRFVQDYLGKPYQTIHSPTHLSWSSTFLFQLHHQLRSIASSLFNLRAWQCFCTTSLQVLFGPCLGLQTSTSFICSPNHCISICSPSCENMTSSSKAELSDGLTHGHR